MSRTQNRFGDRLLMALVFLFLYAPIIILIVFSFNAGTSSSVWTVSYTHLRAHET